MWRDSRLGSGRALGSGILRDRNMKKNKAKAQKCLQFGNSTESGSRPDVLKVSQEYLMIMNDRTDFYILSSWVLKTLEAAGIKCLVVSCDVKFLGSSENRPSNWDSAGQYGLQFSRRAKVRQQRRRVRILLAHGGIWTRVFHLLSGNECSFQQSNHR